MLRQVKTPQGSITYELVHTRRASLELRLSPGGLKLFVPPAYSLRKADQFVLGKLDWINQSQARLDAYHNRERAAYPMTDGMLFPLEGREVRLRLKPGGAWRASEEGDVLTLCGPDLSPDAVSENLRKYLIDRAGERLRQRVACYAPLIGRTPGRITIREQRTKWGSCSTQGNVNFNWKLIMAPREALDYVVIHELCHLYEFNHSPAFWQRVARYQNDYAQWRDFLRSGWAHPYN